MTEIIKQRITAVPGGDFVVFLIGMRINKPWKIHKWLPVALAMPKMVDELYKTPDLGFLGHHQWLGQTTIMVQYWKSFEHLENYAKSRSALHLPAWKAFNQKVASNGDVGIWHETYLINKGRHESVYNNMPLFGLAKATEGIVVGEKQESAKKRINPS